MYSGSGSSVWGWKSKEEHASAIYDEARRSDDTFGLTTPRRERTTREEESDKTYLDDSYLGGSPRMNQRTYASDEPLSGLSALSTPQVVNLDFRSPTSLYQRDGSPSSAYGEHLDVEGKETDLTPLSPSVNV